MHSLYSKSLEELEVLENITLPKFNADIAWAIGSYIREIALAEHPNKGIVIDISLASGQILFHTTSNSSLTSGDNDEWVRRKQRTVVRFGKSSFYVGSKLRLKNKSMEDALFISLKEYASHGGSVPIRVQGLDTVVGTLTVSGLAQEEDHLLALKGLEKFQ